jgi:hypothetical protein
VLAHQVEAMGEELDRVESAAAVPGVERGVRRLAAEGHPEVDHRLAAPGVGADRAVRMPGEDDVHVLKQPLADQVELAADRLLGRRAVEADGALELAGLDQLLDRGRGAEARDPEEVVAAAVASRARHQRLLAGLGLLGDPRQGVVLAEDADHRPSLAVSREERRGHSGHAALDAEALGFREVGERLGRPRLAQSRLGIAPDLVGEPRHLGAVPVDGRHGGLLVGAHCFNASRLLRDGQRRNQKEQKDRSEGGGQAAAHESSLREIRKIAAEYNGESGEREPL